MFYLIALLAFGAGTYLYNFGFKQKSAVVKVGGAVVSIGAAVLIILSAFYGHIGKDWDKHRMGEESKPAACPMMGMPGMRRAMMNMDCGCENMRNPEVQRPPIGPDKYHQPMRHLMTDPMEAKPKK